MYILQRTRFWDEKTGQNITKQNFISNTAKRWRYLFNLIQNKFEFGKRTIGFCSVRIIHESNLGYTCTRFMVN